MSETKICTRCGETKPVDEYYLKSDRKVQRRRSECRECSDARRRATYTSGRYQVTAERYAEMLVSQGGRCAVCGTTDPGAKGTFAIDHDHACCPGSKSCGECVRGLLCLSCNVGLGHFRDNPGLLRSAANYLEDRS